MEPQLRASQSVGPNLWVRLHRPYGGAGAGEEVRVTSAEEKRRLIDVGLAEDCPSPEETIIGRVACELSANVTQAAVEAVDRRLKAFAEAGAASSHRPLPAEPRDERREKLAGFRSAGEFWTAVVNAGTPGKLVDDRLIRKAPLGLNTGEGSEGGFLVPEAVSDEIIELVFDDANLLARTDSEAISANSITLKAVEESSRATGSRRGGVQAYWLAEAEQYTASKPRFREVTFRPHKLGVFYYATDEELSDVTGFSLEQKLAQYAAEEISWLVNEAILTGDGVGKPLGILNSGCLVTVTKEPGQAADTIVFPNIVKMYARMLPRSINSAVWLVNVDTLPQLMQMAFPNAAGSVPAFLNGNAFPTASESPFGSLLGRPILVTEHNPTLGDKGDILFADLSMYKTVTRGGVSSAMSIHVRFDFGEAAFRFDFRIDGQPWLDAPIAPAKGTAALAPFVTLQERT
jgi:HK97 family phage major capsid protein